ncbi:MAG: hypothetical protein IJC59_06460 [Lachnospiraceae bacterium]|nr:hypothetical protein [Lachnospiraceae bacterium]
MDKKNIYFIGGSPCAGKSTVAEYLSQKYGMYYFKVDDQLDRYVEMGAKKGLEMCAMFSCLNADQTWMRDPQVQCRDELAWYEEVFEFFLEDIEKLQVDRPVITEGAAFLPVLMKKIGVAQNRYISITPTAEFQLCHYKQRHWIPYILADCKDKEKCYENWMNRDILFAGDVRRQCAQENYRSVVNDGSRSIEEMRALVIEHFELDKGEIYAE